ncbi:MAG: hypothetical protein LBI10_10855 [Deltaproteobacteria bacterium]|jgi:hypothetical protein|nr:hypothetical protein [Deltaproteobacteria bacterium]
MIKRFFKKIFKLTAAIVVALVGIPLLAYVFRGSSIVILVLGGLIVFFYYTYRVLFTPEAKNRLDPPNAKDVLDRDPRPKPRLEPRPQQPPKQRNVKVVVYDSTQTRTIDQYAELIDNYIQFNGNTFKSKLSLIRSYCEKFIKKRTFVNNALLGSLEKTELTYIKFSGILNNIDQYICNILNDILSRLHAFDEDEYEEILNSHDFNSSTYLERSRIYTEYINYIDSAAGNIDKILVKLDQLLLETSKVKSLNFNNLNNIDTINDIDSLINNIKRYKL